MAITNFKEWCRLTEASDDPWRSLREMGLSRLGPKDSVMMARTDFNRFAAAVDAADESMDFSRERAYLEAVPPTQGRPGWLCFAPANEDAWLVKWTDKQDNEVLEGVRTYFLEKMSSWRGDTEQKYEDQALSYSGSDNAEFDKILEQWRSWRERSDSLSEMANKIQSGAARRLAAMRQTS